MTAERMDFWEFLYVDKGNILVRAADDFAESGAVLLTLRREREEKADDSKRFELTEETAHLKSSRLIQVVHYMQEHVQEQIDMNTLCDVFYMSRSTLQHLFHKEFGCGPMEYFSRMKIRRAREMMREEMQHHRNCCTSVLWIGTIIFPDSLKKKWECLQWSICRR